MLAIYTSLACDNWAAVGPIVQLAHNTAYSKTLEEPFHYLMFGRAAKLPLGLVLGVPATAELQSRLDFPRRTMGNSQLEYGLARRNLKCRTDKQAVEK